MDRQEYVVSMPVLNLNYYHNHEYLARRFYDSSELLLLLSKVDNTLFQSAKTAARHVESSSSSGSKHIAVWST